MVIKMRIYYLDNLSSFSPLGQLQPELNLVRRVKKGSDSFQLYEVRSLAWDKKERLALIFKTCTQLFFTFGLAAVFSKKVREQWSDMCRSKKWVAYYLKESSFKELSSVASKVTAANPLAIPIPNQPSSATITSSATIESREANPLNLPSLNLPVLEKPDEGKVIPQSLKRISLDLSDQKLEEGVNPKMLSKEQKNALLQLAYNWKQREDKEKPYYSLEELATLLSIPIEDLKSLFRRLAITYGDEIPIYTYKMNELARVINSYVWNQKGFENAHKYHLDIRIIWVKSFTFEMPEDPNQAWIGCKETWSIDELVPFFYLSQADVEKFLKGIGCQSLDGNYTTQDILTKMGKKLSTSETEKWNAYHEIGQKINKLRINSLHLLEPSKAFLEERKKADRPPLVLGLTPAEIRRNEAQFQKWIANWKNLGKVEELEYTFEGLQEALQTWKEELERFLKRLQIIQRPIPTTAIRYYLKCIEKILNNEDVPCLPNEFHRYLHEGLTSRYIVFANSEERFPPLSIKENWTLHELSLYLAIDEDFLKTKLQQERISSRNGVFYSNEIKQDFLKKLSEDVLENPSLGIEKNSIRFAGLGTNALL